MRRRWQPPAAWHWLLLHSLLVQGVVAVVRPTVSYRAIELGVPVAWLGALAASFAVAPLVVAFAVGTSIDRRGARPVLLTGAALVVGSAVGLLLLSTSGWWLASWSVLLGLGHLLGVVAGQTVTAATLAPGDVDHAFGVYTFAAAAGHALGPAVVGVLGGAAAVPDTRRILAAAVVASLLLAAVTVRLVLSDGTGTQRRTGHRGGEVREALSVPGLPRAVLVSLVVLSSIDVLAVYLPALGAERGLAAGTVGALLAVRAVASMVTRFALGALVARWGRRRVLVVGTAAAALATGAIAAPLPVAGLAVVVAVGGLGLGIGQPLTLSWVASVAPSRIRATALSLRISGNRLGQTVVPAAVGLVAVGAGASGVFLASGLALAAAAVVSGGGRGAPDPRSP